MSNSGSLETAPYSLSAQSSFWERARTSGTSLCSMDILVFAMLLGFGALQFLSPQHALDFQKDDVFYADAARSIIQHGIYGINGHAEANQPPGLPALLALLCLAGSCTHIVFLRAMALFETLGFLVTYELLKRQVPRIIAAAICLLLLSSRIFFLLATQWVFPSFPYFFTSMAALLVARKFERSATFVSHLAWGTLLTLLIVASLMFASAGMAFLAAIAISVAVVFLRNRKLAYNRVKLYLAVFLIGAAIQGFWMHRKHAPLEWPVPGYPQSYLAQLKVKSGNNPELGMATLRDIPVRVLKNAADGSVLLSQSLLHRWVDVAWMSALVTGPIVLALLGWGVSVWRRRGSIQDWYFMTFLAIYLLWPWKMETRFLLPVAPLACFYIWRGGAAILSLAKHRPRLLALAWYPMAVILAVSSWFWMHGEWIASQMTHAGLQDETSFAIWVLSAILAVRILWAETSWQKASFAVRDWLSRARIFRLSPVQIFQALAAIGVATICLTGLSAQVSLARANVDYDSQKSEPPPDVLAAKWINSHTEPGAIVMARYVPIVYHYSNRKIVWFPPSSNPDLLMAGIQKHKVGYIVVAIRDADYYFPPESVCMAALLSAYPKDFELVYTSSEFKIFRPLARVQGSEQASSGTQH
ncbi:MAG: hypothetical protein WA853_11330 [Candidatus Acidiferrum sp.]